MTSLAVNIKTSLSRDWLNHAAGFFRALALVQADVLLLQGFMLVSSKFTVYRLARKKDTTATAYALLFTGLSAYATFRLLRERLVWLSEEEHEIWATHFEHQSALTQPMFKKLMSCAEVKTVKAELDDPTATGDSHAAPALSDYFSAKYPCRGDRVLTIGGVPTLSLLLEGKARIVRDLARNESDYRRDEQGEVKWPPKPRSIKPVLVERGPGFNGEVSFIDRQAGTRAGMEGREVRAIADVTFTPGSRYVLWDTPRLETLLQRDPALRNALLAHLAAATAKKLFEVTWAVGKANEQGAKLKHMLYDEFYTQEVLDVLWQALTEATAAGGTAALRQPNGAVLLRSKLDVLRQEHGLSDKKVERALQQHGIDLKACLERGDSLLALCEAVARKRAGSQGEKLRELKQARKADKARNRVVRMDTPPPSQNSAVM